MLRSLHIENVAVIRSADLTLENGFSVLTGETGAGKSIIIDSINLLLGNRATREIIRTGERTAVVSAVFEELSPAICQSLSALGFPREEPTLMLQRTITADGRSQTRLDGQLITQSVQKEIARMLVSIHGQNDSQTLLQKATHHRLLDAYAANTSVASAYSEAYRALKEARRQLEAISHDAAEVLRRSEMLRYQIEDIDAMKLREGEEETLTKERDRLLHLELINKQSHFAFRALRGSEKGSAYDLTRRAKNAVHGLCGIVEGAEGLEERLEAVASELDDIAESVLAFSDGEDTDPTARIDKLEARLEGISKLKRKYGADITQILAFRARAAAELEALSTSDEDRAALEKQVKRLMQKATACAVALRETRRAAALQLTGEITQALSFLDMPKVRFDVRITPTELSETGGDEVEFLIATNPGEPLLPLIRIASGGELSRIMLALRSVLNDHDGADTVIFDEIDTGVSGKTSRKVGIKLKESAQGAQVLCVTHSAQIASLADTHYLISKNEREGRAETTVHTLAKEARIEEVARILGGIHVTEVQRNAAKEMIEEYQ